MASRSEAEDQPIISIPLNRIRSDTFGQNPTEDFIDDDNDSSSSSPPCCWQYLTYLISPFYILCSIGILAAYITGFVLVDLKSTLICSILGASSFLSMFSAYMIYLAGSMDDQIDRLEEENDNYQNELAKVTQTRQKLGNENDKLENTVGHLKTDADVLDEKSKEFEGLVDDLGGIAQEHEDIHEVLSKTGKLFKQVRKVMIQIEKSQLLTMYYECAFRDNDDTMDKNEYIRFLARLGKEERKRFKELGSFEFLAGDDGCIDLKEFEHFLGEYCKVDEQKLLEEFKDL